MSPRKIGTESYSFLFFISNAYFSVWYGSKLNGWMITFSKEPQSHPKHWIWILYRKPSHLWNTQGWPEPLSKYKFHLTNCPNGKILKFSLTPFSLTPMCSPHFTALRSSHRSPAPVPCLLSMLSSDALQSSYNSQKNLLKGKSNHATESSKPSMVSHHM